MPGGGLLWVLCPVVLANCLARRREDSRPTGATFLEAFAKGGLDVRDFWGGKGRGERDDCAIILCAGFGRSVLYDYDWSASKSEFGTLFFACSCEPILYLLPVWLLSSYLLSVTGLKRAASTVLSFLFFSIPYNYFDRLWSLGLRLLLPTSTSSSLSLLLLLLFTLVLFVLRMLGLGGWGCDITEWSLLSKRTSAVPKYLISLDAPPPAIRLSSSMSLSSTSGLRS